MDDSRLTPTASPGARTVENSDLVRGAAKHASAFLRDLAVEQRSVSTLKINPRNARTHSTGQVKAIADSIQAFGFTTPVLIDDDGMILAGHGRLQVAKLLRLDAVPAIQISALSEPQKRAFILAENKLAERAGWDRELLAVELGELSSLLPDLGLSVDLTGFEVGEIDIILNDGEENKSASPDDDLVLPPRQPVSRLGDLWLLGRHRLLCGDARDQDAIRRLLGDERVELVFTDPPHNVRVDGHARGKGKRLHAEFAMASGEMSEAELVAFLRQVMANAAARSRDGALHYVCMDWRHFGELLTAGRSIYGEPQDLIVWVKGHVGPGRFYRSQHELIAIFQVGDGEHVDHVEFGRFGRNRSNVWHYAGVNRCKPGRQEELEAHPTVKPVVLVADAIKDVTCRGAIVLDLFGGSGTTLMAAERTGRRARLLEIAPRDVDVTIARFEKITKADAVHAESGRPFAELAQERRAASTE